MLPISCLMGAALAATPIPYEADPVAAEIIDTVDLFDLVSVDSGYWPSATDPIAIRFFFTPEIVVESQLQTNSQLAWSPLSVRTEGSAESTLRADVEIGAEVKLDLFGIFSGVVPIASRSVHLETEASSEGLLLQGSPDEILLLSIDDPSLVPPLEYGVDVVPTVAVTVGVGITPKVDASIEGLEVISEIDGQSVHQYTADEWAELPEMPARPGEVGLLTRWSSYVEALFAVQLTPSVGVDTPIGGFTLAEFPLDIDLAEISELRESEPAFVIHALPVLLDPQESYDYGEIPSGDLANWPLVIENIGAMILEGTASVDGDPAFTVWPEAFAAPPGVQSGLTVSFSPTSPGEHRATLRLLTNDPTRPSFEIALVGVASGEGSTDPSGDVPPLDTAEGDSSTIKTCGCASPPLSGVGLLAALGAALFSRRRPCSGEAEAPSDDTRPELLEERLLADLELADLQRAALR